MKISVIIPTFNESEKIPYILEFLKKNSSAEIIVSDGGSTDETVEIAKQAKIKAVSSKKGRAVQMNHGSKKSTGDIFYFLHADSIPPRNFEKLILGSLKTGASCGTFTRSYDKSRLILDFYDWFSTNVLGVFLGDQSFFITKKLFNKINGYNDSLKVMEDFDIVSRARKKAQFVFLKTRIKTSSRKYQDNGFYWLSFVYTLVFVMYFLRIPQRNIVDLYRAFVKNNRI